MSDNEETLPTPGTQPSQGATSSTASTSTNANVPHSGLPPFAPFDPHSDRASIGLRWRKWTRRFENLLISLREFDPTVRQRLLLTYVGEATNDIFDTLSHTGTDYATAIACLTAHFDPVRNKDMDIYDLWQIKQEPGESLQSFHRRLKEKAILCEFPNQDVEIKTQIIHHTSDSRIRQKALRKSMDLTALLDFGYSLEKSDLVSKRI